MARTNGDQHHRLPLATADAIASIPMVPDTSRGHSAPHLKHAAPGSAPDDLSDDDLLQVGDLAKQSGKTVRAIHLYEELGLPRPPPRSKGRYRLFSADAVTRVRWIGKLQDLGLSLPTIQ